MIYKGYQLYRDSSCGVAKRTLQMSEAVAGMVVGVLVVRVRKANRAPNPYLYSLRHFSGPAPKERRAVRSWRLFTDAHRLGQSSEQDLQLQ